LPEEEALLGLKALQAEGKIASTEECISWENGGGSTQITFISKEGPQFFTKNLGKIPVKNYIIRQIQGKDPKEHISPNPISQSQAKAALAWLEEELKDAPSWLKEKPSIKVVALGAIFPNLYKALEKLEVTKQDLLELLADRIGKTDEELKGSSDPIFMVSDLLFLYAVMEKLHIGKVEYGQVNYPDLKEGA
jgi:exopolyphosphatase/pppGpp-phosphohydrolase